MQYGIVKCIKRIKYQRRFADIIFAFEGEFLYLKQFAALN